METGTARQSAPAWVICTCQSPCRLNANDPDGDNLKYKWEIRTEAVYASYAGQGEKVPETVPGLINGESAEISFKAPPKPGPYRLFGYVYDNKGHFSTVNLPFMVPPGAR